MKRRAFVAGLVAAVALPLAARAQQPKKIPVIGLLLVANATALIDSLRMGLRDLGWIEGDNIRFEARSASTLATLPQAAAELVSIPVDVIFATSSVYVEAARQATKTIPIVFATHADPIGVGHVTSLAHPGGNITGQSQLLTELVSKQLEILKDAIPRATKIGVLWDPGTPSHLTALESVRVTAEKLRIGIILVPARSMEEHDSALSKMSEADAQAMLAVQSVLTFQNRFRLAELGLKKRLPGMFGVRENVAAGGLMSYGANLSDLHRRAASHIDKILRGANPADLPVEQATKFELVINLKAAKALGLAIPPALLALADEVIE
jgi:putative ABC transport system substrate-binding protein